MFMGCRWCQISKNGQLAIAEHERIAHPREYWSAKVENLKRRAEQNLAEAEKIKQRFLS